MTKRLIGRGLVLLLCAIAALGLFAAAAFADGAVPYVERSWNGTQVVSTDQTHTAEPVPSNGNMTSGWYYLNSNVTKNGRVESITGDVCLILGDGYTLDVKGLYVPQGSTLTIYAQSDGENAGKIYSHPSGGAAIGGYSGHDNGNIVIHGGTIEATGYDHCAGIGSNDGKTGDAITIYGGEITATGGSDGAGIGGGRNCDGGNITIYGGTITAHGGGENGAGIGGGDSASGGTINIYGGTITANEDPNEDGAAIGGGDCGNGGTITIHGGTLTLYSRDGAGIGGGDDGDGGTITIHGGTITSTKVNQGQGARIGGGCDGAPGTIIVSGGTVTTIGGSGAGIGGGKGNKSGGSVTIDGGIISASCSYGIGSGEEGADVAITLGWTDATSETISITASSYGGTIAAAQPFKTDTTLIYPGTVTDVSPLAGSTLLAWDGKITSWGMLQLAVNSAQDGAVITLQQSLTANSSDTAIVVPGGKTVTLDLNGFTLDRAMTDAAADGYVIRNNGTLIIIDSGDSEAAGTIRGGWNTGDGGGIYNTGTLNLQGGLIETNKSGGNGGGIYNAGTVNMTGGTIRLNSADTGGGGVHVSESANLVVSGSPTVENNTKGELANNINLAGNAVIQVDGALAEGARLGVFISGAFGVFTDGYGANNTASPDSFFFADTGGWCVFLEEGEGSLSSTWEQFRLSLNQGGSIALTEDITAFPYDSILSIPAGVTVELDLQGHTLDASALNPPAGVEYPCCLSINGILTLSDTVGGGRFKGSDNGFTDFIAAESGSSFTMNGGAIVGSGTLENVVYVYDYATFTMHGGAVTADMNGTVRRFGRVRMSGGSIEENIGGGAGGGLMILGGTTTMSGGSIKKNQTWSPDAAGVEIGAGTFRMTGGEISNNVALVTESVATRHGTVFGGGVSVRSGTTFEVSGSPKVGNNTISVIGMEGLINVDVLVASDAYMTVTGPFTSGADLSVFPGKVGSEITKGLSTNGGSDPLNYLKCNVGDPDNPLAIQINVNGEAVIGPRAVVTYKANGGSGEDVKDNAVRDMEGYILQENSFTPPDGQMFYNWQIGGETYYPGDTYSPAGNTDVLAVWGTDQCFTVRFEPGHEEAGGIMREVRIEKTGETASYTLPDCGFTAPDGYEFTGWIIGDAAASSEPGETITLTNDVTLTAVWRSLLGDWAGLQNQIDTAADNDIITLENDYKATGEDTALEIPSGKSLTLDLNGHTINRNASYDSDPVLYVYGSLVIRDSSSGQTGKITGGTDSGIKVGKTEYDLSTWESVGYPGYLTLQSGSITKNTGGGVYVNCGRFTMSGGIISYNTGGAGASAVYVAGDKDVDCFIMTGGKIVHNTFRNGGGVYLARTSGTMSGGEISDNHATGEGGGIHLQSSNFTLSGGKIVNNTTDGNGGGIFTRIYGVGDENIKLIISGGEISGNKAESYGGGIYTRSNALISGGIITGNTAGDVESVGSGVYQEYHSRIELEGTPVITGNAAGNGKADNLTLNDEKVSITGTLTSNALVGVNVWVDSEDLVPDGDGYVVFTTGLKGNGSAANFSSDNGASAVSLNSDGEAELGWIARAAAPVFSPESGTYTEAQNVEISCGTDGATIYYTTDGTDPTPESTEYSGPVPVTGTTTIKAIAVANEMANSEIAEATYTMKTATPAFSPEPGTYDGEQQVTITCATEGAAIYYTTDLFTNPLEDGIEYTGAIPVTASVTIKAAAVKDGIEPSDIALGTYSLNAVYMLDVTAPEFSPVKIGYAQPAAQPLTIVSSSNTLTTISSVALSGEGASAFVLNKTDGATIAAGATDDTTYTVRPAAGLAVGTYTATVTVAYDNDETAQAEVSFTVEDLEPCEVVICVQKTLSGCEWTTEDGFEFTLAPVGEAPAPEIMTETVTIDSVNHTEVFESITITAPGTYSWTVSETHKGETLDGIQYAAEDQTVTVIVKNDETGKLTAEEGSSLTPTVTFTNTFAGYSVTFRVVNGSWDDDGTKADRTITVGYNQTIPLDDIPDVGNSPDEGYMKNGSWDVEPPLETPITQDVTYTYTYYPPFGDASFTLPSGAKTVEASAFEGDTLISIVDASSCETIGAYAFSGCTGLTKIRLPINCTIGEHAFDGCTALYAIYGPTGGTTQDWAENHDILFIGE